jgi:uncharacterized membrane protein
MKTNSHLIYGIPAALLSLVLFIGGTYSSSLPSDGFIMSWGPRLLLFAAIFLAGLDFRKKSEVQTFGGFFGNGFRTTAVVTVLFVIGLAIFLLTMPGFRDKLLAEAAINGAKMGYDAETIKANQENLKSILLPSMMAGVLIPQLIIGAIFSAVTAGILKKQ